jgi:hypothetical protein
MDYVAVDLYIEEVIQLDGPQNGRAVLTRGDDGDFEPTTAELMNEFNASLIRLDPSLFNDLIDQLVLAVPQPAHRFSVLRIVGGSLGELDTARCEKVTNTIEARLPIDI